MDMISELPDDLLLKVLSLLLAKDVVATMVLSKRWKFLWKFVPKLEYESNIYQDVQDMRFSRFVNNSLRLHEAPVLESLRFKLNQKSGATIDIGSSARRRCLLELIIETDYSPSSTQTVVFHTRSCFGIMLVTLKLDNAVLMDFNYPVSFPCLKKLSLDCIKYDGGDEFVNRLLSNCSVLEDLVVGRCENDNVINFAIRVPSLESLLFTTSPYTAKDDAKGSVINAPSLKILNINDKSNGFCLIEKKMLKIEKAYLDVDYSCTKELLGPIALVKQLNLCLSTSMEAYQEGKIYSQLVRLELCICKTEWWGLLMRLLKDSPKLRFLKLEEYHLIQTGYIWPSWSEPSYVPECLSLSLETFIWMPYEGREVEKQVARFIIENSSRLKGATFYHKSIDPKEQLAMLIDLSMLSRSSTCVVALKDMALLPRYR